MENGVIYCYCYEPTGEKYIGQTMDIKKRKREHLNNNRTNQRFHNLLKKHYDDFSFYILEEDIEKEKLNEREQYWIEYYDTFKGFGFNLTPGGDGGFQYCQNYWKNNPEKMREHIEKIQPMATEAAKEWRKNNPELEKERLNNLHKKASEWRENNPEKVKEHQSLCVEAMKKWREEHEEEFKKNRQKAVDKTKKGLFVKILELFMKVFKMHQEKLECQTLILELAAIKEENPQVKI